MVVNRYSMVNQWLINGKLAVFSWHGSELGSYQNQSWLCYQNHWPSLIIIHHHQLSLILIKMVITHFNQIGGWSPSVTKGFDHIAQVKQVSHRLCRGALCDFWLSSVFWDTLQLVMATVHHWLTVDSYQHQPCLTISTSNGYLFKMLASYS